MKISFSSINSGIIMRMDPRLVHIIRAARKGGKILRRYFGESLETSIKSSVSDLTTKADTESEEEILQVLKSEFPDYNIWSEEVGRVDNESQYTFVVDPLDGTSNFVAGIPTFSVSIALQRRDTTLLGVVYSPFLESAFYGQRGFGSFFEGVQLQVSGEKEMTHSIFATSAGYKTERDFETQMGNKLTKAGAKRVINEWSTAYCLCLLASGRLEGVISNGAEFYDFAAGKLIAAEAGAIITDLQGESEKVDTNNLFVLGCTREIHDKLLNLTRTAI